MSKDSRSILKSMIRNPVVTDKFENLVAQAIDTLENLLNSNVLSASERAQIALKILEMAGSSSPKIVEPPLDDSGNTSGNGGSSQPILPGHRSPQQSGSPTLLDRGNSIFLPANYVQIDNFLSPEENAEALKIAIDGQQQFITSTTTTNAENYRQSWVLYATLFPDFYELLKKKIIKIVPSVIAQLKMPEFLISKVEMQLTAHNDGCYYKVHNDSGSPTTAARELTYVYYFCQEPPQFSEGALRIYDTELKEGTANQYNTFKDIEPRNNRIVLFNSRCKHEVLPVRCPSKKFEDSRFTLNGWIRRVEV
jgi:Rps23 Pro-64 3,4-dihydroxylase Tpa1-like proline 4-hydroxylase